MVEFKKKIPNLDTISTYWDRQAIETVKYFQMKNRGESDEKLADQNAIREDIKFAHKKAFLELLREGTYEYHGETRTIN